MSNYEQKIYAIIFWQDLAYIEELKSFEKNIGPANTRGYESNSIDQTWRMTTIDNTIMYINIRNAMIFEGVNAKKRAVAAFERFFIGSDFGSKETSYMLKI
ncbi:MAG: hypothetical protein GX864_00325 [Mollicutes bacterium]|jgi:hypothetical protein|nr:hypothetical protein [Mollicutes bacterium]